MATLELVNEKCWVADCARRPTWIVRGKDGKEVARACAADAKKALVAQTKKENGAA
jgi:hypothetical protein